MTLLQRFAFATQVGQCTLVALPRRIAAGALDLDEIGDLRRAPFMQLLAQGGVQDADMHSVDPGVLGRGGPGKFQSVVSVPRRASRRSCRPCCRSTKRS